jgi:putative endonuclease
MDRLGKRETTMAIGKGIQRLLAPGDPLEEWSDDDSTVGRGATGEREAEAFLVREGYEILEHNVRVKAGEIDLVALDGKTLCFVEVRARSGDSCGTAAESITERKMRRISRAAALYLCSRPHDGPCRFDVVTLDQDGHEPWRIEVLKNAFDCWL